MAFRYGGALVRPVGGGTLVDPDEDTGLRYAGQSAKRGLQPGEVGASRGAPGGTNYNLQVQAWNRRMAGGEQTTPTWTSARYGAAQSPAARSESEIAELRGMLQRGEITQEQYDRLVGDPNSRWSRFTQTIQRGGASGVPRGTLFMSAPA